MKKLTYILLSLLLVCSLSLSAFASETVEKQIADLPTVEEFKAMDSEAQLEAYNRTQAVYDAYMALSEEEKAQIEGAEATFETLFAYFNTLIAPAGEVENSGGESDNTFAWILIVALISTAATLLVRERKK